MKDLSIRVFSGLIGFGLLLFIVYKGGVLLNLSIYIIAIIAIRELYKAFEHIDIKPIYSIGYFGVTFLFLVFTLSPNLINIALTLLTISSLSLIVFFEHIKVKDIALTLLGILYIPFLLFHIIYLGNTKYIWMIFIISFGTDTFAYITGNLIGKRKLSPKVSPNKTVEGSIGGIIGAVVLSLIYANINNIGSIVDIVIISFLGSIISQIGDLTASKIKRQAGIKDYGFIMPGHGGVLDRFDSIIFATPVIYYYISIFII